MRQMFTSPRLSNVEGVAKLFDEHGIANKVTQGRTYKKVSRREFSFREGQGSKDEQPAVWVLRPEDYKRARELLLDGGLVDAGTRDSYLPDALQFKEPAKADPNARIFRIKEAVPLAALPSSRTQCVLDAICDAYPQFIDGVDVLNTGMNNMGAIFHPALTLLNMGWIEATHGDYQFYIDGVTPSVARVLEVLDRERVTVASALGIRARTSLEWLKLAYDTTGVDLHEAIHNQPGYYGIKAPATLNHRYIFEDVPMSLVPIASLGKRYGVFVRGMESMIQVASIIHRTDYWRRGRTVEKLGLEQWSVSELTRFVQEGKID